MTNRNMIRAALLDGPKTTAAVAAFGRARGAAALDFELARTFLVRMVRENEATFDGRVYSPTSSTETPAGIDDLQVVDDVPEVAAPPEPAPQAPVVTEAAAPSHGKGSPQPAPAATKGWAVFDKPPRMANKAQPLIDAISDMKPGEIRILDALPGGNASYWANLLRSPCHSNRALKDRTWSVWTADQPHGKIRVSCEAWRDGTPAPVEAVAPAAPGSVDIVLPTTDEPAAAAAAPEIIPIDPDAPTFYIAQKADRPVHIQLPPANATIVFSRPPFEEWRMPAPASGPPAEVPDPSVEVAISQDVDAATGTADDLLPSSVVDCIRRKLTVGPADRPHDITERFVRMAVDFFSNDRDGADWNHDDDHLFAELEHMAAVIRAWKEVEPEIEMVMATLYQEHPDLSIPPGADDELRRLLTQNAAARRRAEYEILEYVRLLISSDRRDRAEFIATRLLPMTDQAKIKWPKDGEEKS